VEETASPITGIEERMGIFSAPEGSANFYLGRIRSGKTYGATADIHEELSQGRVVYATWPIKVQNFDDRDSWTMVIMNFLLFRDVYYKIDCQKNFHFINAET